MPWVVATHARHALVAASAVDRTRISPSRRVTAGMAGHGGMMSDADMDALMQATAADAARLYLEGMVEHHQGAIDAAETEIADGQYEPAIALAKEIKTAQAAEIVTMRALHTSVSRRVFRPGPGPCATPRVVDGPGRRRRPREGRATMTHGSHMWWMVGLTVVAQQQLS